MSDKPDKPSSPLQQQTDVAEAARQFWKLWQKSPPPDIEQFLKAVGPLAPVRLAAVLCVDLRERWKRQQRTPPEDYLRRFPQVLAEPEAALDVVYCEFLLRDEQGEAPTPTEYAARFPQLAGELLRQIEMHRLLQASDDEIAGKAATLSHADGKAGSVDYATALTHVPSSASKPVKPASARPPGSKNWPILPGFEILDRLGRGGMGVVYKAWQEKLYRVVAVKMLQPESGDSAQALARFRVESEAIARLHHANIVQVHEVGEHDGRPFLVIEYAEGGTLAQKANGTPWHAKDAAQMVETLARAVHYAHQRGVLHRDLTPGNVLLFADGTPKLSDFGLAKLLVGGSTLTQSGAVVGTPSYMSPEQARGTSHDVGPTVDVYSLGAILYELLTGRPPFKATTPLETLAQVAHADPVSPRQLQPTVPRDLETICVKCLRKEPGRRYATAAELADDLQRFLKKEPIRARPVGKIERVWRWGRRNPGWASALLLLLLTAVVAIGASYYLSQALARTDRARHKAEVEVFEATINLAQAKRLNGRVGQRELSLALLEKARKLAKLRQLPDEDFKLRNGMIACLALPDLELVKEWDGFPPSTYGLDFDESMTHYARGDIQGKISVHQITDDKEVASFPLLNPEKGGEPATLRFSPDGKFLAVSSAGNLRLWDIEAHKSFDLPLTRRFSFGMQGRRLAILHGDGVTISVHDMTTHGEILRCVPGVPIANLAFHPDLQVLALAGDKETVLYDLKSKQIMKERLPHPDRVCCLAWAHNGWMLATGCDDKYIRVWELGAKGSPGQDKSVPATDAAQLQGMRQLREILSHSTKGMEVQLNHNGTIVASSNWNNNLRLWDARSGQQLVMPLAEAGLFRFAANDDQLGCTAPGGKLRLYRTIAGREFRRLPAFHRYPLAGVRAVVFHPTGNLLFAAGADGLVSIDMNKMAAQALPLASAQGTIPIAFDAQGALITESALGFQSWPAVADPADGKLIRFGPPRLLAGPPRKMRERELRAAFGGVDAILVFPDQEDGARLWGPADSGTQQQDPAMPSYREKSRLGQQRDIRYCAVSPDGRWAATGSNDAPGQPAAVIWDAKTGAKIQVIPALPRNCDVGFSPDSQWFITTGGGCRLWKTGSWEPGPVLGGGAFAFAPSGGLLAVEGMEGQVRLVDPADGKEFAHLTAPGELHSLPICFNHDGSLLVVYGSESQALHVWDLRSIRDRLSKSDLDWDLPALPAALAGPTQVEMVER